MRPQASGEKWLVISYYYGVDGSASSHHIEDRVEALNTLGVKTRVLYRTGVLHAPFMQVEKFTTSLEKFKSSAGPARLIAALHMMVSLTRAALLIFREWDEVLCFADLAGEGYALAQRERFSRIYSTGGPLGAHLAALLLAARTRLPLLVEFQDPLPFQYPQRFHKLALLTEKIAMKRARCVFMTRRAALAAARRCRTRMPAAIHPGAAPITKTQIPTHGSSPQNTLRLAHFGALYRGRNTAHFVAALEALLNERPELQSVVQVHCYGALDRIAQQTAACSVPGVLRLHEKISRAQAIHAMTTTDILLLIQHTEPISSETIPSKTYEYLHSARPILALTYRNPELTGMLKRLGHFAVEADDEAAIRQALATLIAHWQKGQLPRPSPSPYTTERAAQKLVRHVA
jgi:hypothetical protein